ncbi:MAG: GAF domain-containing protein, partial [Anaerolineae bacterium]|nr:GAF domain-containing protein [Anaerolineae bacterium]
MALNSTVSSPAETKLNDARLPSLPWWTWVLPFFIANLGTWLSIWFKTDPGASLWYLPTAFGIVMAYWWGPRALLGVYLNAVLCAPLWDLPWQWSFLYALPETIEVWLSWLFFIKLAQGKCWLPDLKNVIAFLLFGSLAPTFIANIYLVIQLYLLGDIPQNAIWDNWIILFSADLATQFVFAVPVLVLFTKHLSEKGWTQVKDEISQLPLLPGDRNSPLDKIFITAIFVIPLITTILFPIHDLRILYGFLLILIAVRYGVKMGVIVTSWIGLLAFLLPIVLTGEFGLPTATYGDFLTTNIDILFLCGVTLVAGRAISDLFTEITEHKQSEDNLSSREQYLILLNDMTRAVLLSKDFDSTLNILAVDMAKLIKADDCYITRWDEERQLTIPTTTTAKLETPYSTQITSGNQLTLTSSVLRSGHAIAVDDVFNSPHISVEIAKRYPTHSVLGVPLIAGEHKLGAAIIAFNTPHHFTSEEIERAEHAANHIALALWNFQQSTEIQYSLKEGNALAEIGRALSETEQTGTDKVLQLIVDSARELISKAEESVIHLLEVEEQSLLARAVSGYPEQDKEFKRVKMRLGEGVAGQVIREGITINIGNIKTDPRFLHSDSMPNFLSLLVAPVQSGGQQIGTISVQSRIPNAFSTKDAELLNSLGVQAALAIENTRLFETTQQRLKEVDALYKTSQGLAASLDTDELIKDVVTLLHQNFGYYHVQIYLLDPSNGDLVLKRGSGEIGAQLLQSRFRLSRGLGIVGHVAETAVPFVANNVNDVVFFDRNPLLPDTQSELSVPIKLDGKVVGVLDIQHTPPHRLTDGDLQLMTAVADQLAVALQKANLYTDLQTALNQEQTIRSQLIQSERLALVGRLLASVSHELNNPMQAIQNALFLLKEENLSNQASQDLDIIL